MSGLGSAHGSGKITPLDDRGEDGFVKVVDSQLRQQRTPMGMDPYDVADNSGRNSQFDRASVDSQGNIRMNRKASFNQIDNHFDRMYNKRIDYDKKDLGDLNGVPLKEKEQGDFKLRSRMQRSPLPSVDQIQ